MIEAKFDKFKKLTDQIQTEVSLIEILIKKDQWRRALQTFHKAVQTKRALAVERAGFSLSTVDTANAFLNDKFQKLTDRVNILLDRFRLQTSLLYPRQFEDLKNAPVF